jgi:hypothetical protein
MFFSEEKNQKTFFLRLHNGACRGGNVRDCGKSKSLLVLFFRKERLLP